MQTHFSSFTPEWARSFGQELAADFERRRDAETERLRIAAEDAKARRDAETERLRIAAEDAEARRLFVSEIQSGVRPLLSRFHLEHQEIASELRAATEAWRSRPRPQADFFSRRDARPEPFGGKKGEQALHAGFEGQDKGRHTEKAGRSRKHTE